MPSPTQPDRPQFLMVTCQVGAEGAVKGELARRRPDFRLAFSRPGLLTFKLPEGHQLYADFDLESVFARAYAFSLGKVGGAGVGGVEVGVSATRGGEAGGEVASEALDRLARGVWETYGDRPVRRLHVWQRDTAVPGDHGFEPSITPAANDAHAAILKSCPTPKRLADDADQLQQPARRGEFVLDCVLIEPDQWLVGYHRALSVPSRWPGGIMPLEMPPEAVSRAWLKMEEALRWSELPIPAGARCAELGSAPGGASQAMLDRGLLVTGIDPAEMHPAVLAHPGLTHLRRRATQVRRREFRKVRWLAADMNVAPAYTLDAVEAIVLHPQVHIRGLLLTLKLPQWELAEEVPVYVERVRGWGYNIVHARQLAHNRQEVCLAALQKPFRRKV